MTVHLYQFAPQFHCGQSSWPYCNFAASSFEQFDETLWDSTTSKYHQRWFFQDSKGLFTAYISIDIDLRQFSCDYKHLIEHYFNLILVQNHLHPVNHDSRPELPWTLDLDSCR
ncbi:hypothetical protein Mapa_012203 [Marchantia paleacea]|nr:hypothetical protein Mapa_012203 [Marchantia paleacea]